MTKRIVTRLDILKSAAVLNYVKDYYVEFKLTDDKFAEKASEALGFPVLGTHVEARRKMLEIAPTNNRPSPKNTAALFALMLELEKRVAALEKQVQNQARLPGV